MNRALLFVYGHASEHVNWGEWHFLQLPAAGDLVVIPKAGEGVDYVKVRHIEHKPVRVDDLSAALSNQTPAAIVIADWQSEYN